jgi:glycosyltransferase involved in cell wall biosynthesis
VLLKVGRPTYPSERLRLLQMVTDMGLHQSVRFIDEVSNADLVSFYNVASVFAFPSISEGFGFPVLEALACGTPVVCSDTPALRELTADAALHAPATSSELLAAQLLRVLLEQDLRLRLRAAGQARAALYTWDRTADATYQIYVNVLGGS